MTDIGSIRSRDMRRDDYQEPEIEAMRKDASPSGVLNEVRKRAGYREADVAVRGDDKSGPELRKEWEDHDMKHAVVGLSAHQIPELLAETAGELLGPGLFAVHAVLHLKTSFERGDALAEAQKKGAMHLAMMTTLDVPQGFKNVEIAKWKESVGGDGSAAAKMGTRLDVLDRDKAAVLQLHADRGTQAGLALIERGVVTRDGDAAQVARAVSQDPALRAKYDADPAFRAGLDGLAWAKQHDTAAYDQMLANLRSRDARYTQHHIAIAG